MASFVEVRGYILFNEQSASSFRDVFFYTFEILS